MAYVITNVIQTNRNFFAGKTNRFNKRDRKSVV